MQAHKVLTLLLLIFSACDRRLASQEKLEDTVRIDAYLTKSRTDTLEINWTGGTPNNWRDAKVHARKKYPFNFFDDNAGICRLSNDTLFISTGQGYGPCNSLEVVVFKLNYLVKLMEHSCTYSHDYITIRQSLKINRSSLHVGDTLTGDIFCQAKYVWDSLRNIVDTTTISGKFKLKIRGEKFDWDSLIIENNRKAMFITLLNTQPDTIKYMDFSNCRLTSLPKEVGKFVNLESLDLERNNLANSELSTLCQLTKIRSLTLNNCNLGQIPSAVFCLNKLNTLKLFDNKLTSLPNELFQMTEMQELQLGSNSLTTLPKEILKMKKLRVLEISGSKDENKIRKLPANFFHTLKNLNEFYSPAVMDASEYKEFEERSNGEFLNN